MFLYQKKIYGETHFQSQKFPRIGSKAKDGKEREKKEKKDRKLVITMSSFALQTPPWVADAKPPGPMSPPQFIWSVMGQSDVSAELGPTRPL